MLTSLHLERPAELADERYLLGLPSYTRRVSRATLVAQCLATRFTELISNAFTIQITLLGIVKHC